MHTTLIYDVTQIFTLAHAKGVFIQVGTQFVLPKCLKDLSDMLKVFFPTLAEDENVIEINNHK